MSVGTSDRGAEEQSPPTDAKRRRRLKALKWMAAQRLPVDDWEAMERGIESRWEPCEDESTPSDLLTGRRAEES